MSHTASPEGGGRSDSTTMGKTLVAGVGNIFLSDDGFGPEVARRLLAEPLPDGVSVGDFGTGGIHLAFELLDGYDSLILVDALPQDDEPPGTLCVLEPDDVPAGAAADADAQPGMVDAHGMEPVAVLGLLATLGGTVDRVLVVGCQPAHVGDGMGLTEPVAAAVDGAMGLVRELLDQLAGGVVVSVPAQEEEPA